MSATQSASPATVMLWGRAKDAARPHPSPAPWPPPPKYWPFEKACRDTTCASTLLE
jgi:hypothetical protein